MLTSILVSHLRSLLPMCGKIGQHLNHSLFFAARQLVLREGEPSLGLEQMRVVVRAQTTGTEPIDFARINKLHKFHTNTSQLRLRDPDVENFRVSLPLCP
jgi:hypothetical protein